MVISRTLESVKEMRRDRESRFQTSHVYSPLAGQAQAVRLAYKLQFNSRYISYIAYWLLANNIVKFIIIS